VVATSEPRVDAVDPPPGTPVAAVALVLHGGRERSTEAVRPGQLAVRRMRPFARRLASEGSPEGLAVWSLQYQVRGWNGDLRSPVGDAVAALGRIRDRHGDVPVVLVGHSMGGRTAIAVAGAPSVVAVAALAPWLPEGEPHEQVAGRSVLVVHGALDTTTSPRGSLAWARRAATVTERIWRVELRWERHAMLLRAPTWHALTTEFALWALDQAPLPPALRDRDVDLDRLRVVR
jgi:pimeloyl-ACP methyl ester carboxylesterase